MSTKNNVRKILLLSGTPGTGKTEISKQLAKEYGFFILSLGDIVVQNNLYSGVDPERDTKIVDIEKFDNYLNQFFETVPEHIQNIICEGHYADLVMNPDVTMAIVLRCHPLTLEKRLQQRNYKISKIKENIQAELVGDCTSYMLERQDHEPHLLLFELDTTSLHITETAKIINEIFNYPEKNKKYHAGSISWLSDPQLSEKFIL